MFSTESSLTWSASATSETTWTESHTTSERYLIEFEEGTISPQTALSLSLSRCFFLKIWVSKSSVLLSQKIKGNSLLNLIFQGIRSTCGSGSSIRTPQMPPTFMPWVTCLSTPPPAPSQTLSAERPGHQPTEAKNPWNNHQQNFVVSQWQRALDNFVWMKTFYDPPKYCEIGWPKKCCCFCLFLLKIETSEDCVGSSATWFACANARSLIALLFAAAQKKNTYEYFTPVKTRTTQGRSCEQSILQNMRVASNKNSKFLLAWSGVTWTWLQQSKYKSSCVAAFLVREGHSVLHIYQNKISQIQTRPRVPQARASHRISSTFEGPDVSISASAIFLSFPPRVPHPILLASRFPFAFSYDSGNFYLTDMVDMFSECPGWDLVVLLVVHARVRFVCFVWFTKLWPQLCSIGAPLKNNRCTCVAISSVVSTCIVKWLLTGRVQWQIAWTQL